MKRIKGESHAKSKLVRNFIFGVEDSLVSTVGLLAGVAAADVDRHTILLTGGVLVAVEALSMGIGSLLSESFADEYVDGRHDEDKNSILAAIVMFGSYALAGIVPLFPYIVFVRETAFFVSIGASSFALFLLGFLGARYFGSRGYRSGLRMFLLGTSAIVVGVLVGQLLHVSG